MLYKRGEVTRINVVRNTDDDKKKKGNKEGKELNK